MTLRGICPNRILSTNTKAFQRPISLLEFVQIVNKQKHLSVGSRDNMSDACVPRSESRWWRRWTCTYVFGVIVSLWLWHHGACGPACLQLVVSHWQTRILRCLKGAIEIKSRTWKRRSLLSVTIPQNMEIFKCHFCWETLWKYKTYEQILFNRRLGRSHRLSIFYTGLCEGASDMFWVFFWWLGWGGAAQKSNSSALQLVLIFLSFHNRSLRMEGNRTSLDAREIMK